MDNTRTQNNNTSQGVQPVKPDPVGWVVMWPKPGGGYSPVYHHGPTRPNFGSELHDLLTQFAVYTDPPEAVTGCKGKRCGRCDSHQCDATRKE